MQSNISEKLKMKFPPIVLLKSDNAPENYIGPKKGGCVMSFIAQTISKRTTSCFSRKDVSCGGLPVAFGWGSGFQNDAMMDFQATFLSCGVESAPDKESYQQRIDAMPKHSREMFIEGERIYSDFDTAKECIQNRPVYDDDKYVIFKGIENLEDDEIPKSVIFTVNPMELTALIQINSSFRVEDNYILTPQASACQAIGCFVFRENESDNPKPVLGPIDFAGRRKMKHFIPDEYLNLSMPWKLFLKLEELSHKSVLQSHLLKKFI